MEKKVTIVGPGFRMAIAAGAVSGIGRALSRCGVKFVACGILSFLILLLSGGDGFASPFETFGLGGRNVAMGGAVSAIAEDYTATHYNPAGVAFAEKPMMGVGLVYGSPDLRLKGENPDFDYAGSKPLSGDKHKIDRIRALQVGGTFPVTKGRLKFLKVGVAVHLPPTAVVRAVSEDANKPHFLYFIAHPHRLEIKTCLAAKISPKLSVGAGAEILIDLDFPVKLQLFNANETFIVGNVTAPPKFTPLAGLKLNATDSLSLSAVYRGDMQLDILLALKLTAGGQQPVPTIALDLINFYKPREAVFGASYAFNKKLLVGMDVAWMDYSKAVTHMPTYEFDVPEWLRRGLSMIEAPPPDFKDVFVPRIGVEYTINDHLAVRTGYFYRPSPVPDQTGNTNYADSNRHGISIGAGVSFQDPWGLGKAPINIDVVFQAQILEQRSVVKTAVDNPTGNYKIEGEIFFGGLYLKHFF